MNRCVLLLSGGMDSSTLLAWLCKKQWEIFPVIFDYNQKHRIEIESAKKVADYYGKKFQVHRPEVLKIDLAQIGNSALTVANWTIPNHMDGQIQTVVPFRNTLLTTMAAAYADGLNITEIFLTPVREDYEAYRDCRPAFYKSLMATLTLGSVHEKEFNVNTPFIKWFKAEVIRWGLQNNVPYELTHSCYKGISPACAECPACRERLGAFEANNIKDPIPYV